MTGLSLDRVCLCQARSQAQEPCRGLAALEWLVVSWFVAWLVVAPFGNPVKAGDSLSRSRACGNTHTVDLQMLWNSGAGSLLGWTEATFSEQVLRGFCATSSPAVPGVRVKPEGRAVGSHIRTRLWHSTGGGRARGALRCPSRGHTPAHSPCGPAQVAESRVAWGKGSSCGLLPAFGHLKVAEE